MSDNVYLLGNECMIAHINGARTVFEFDGVNNDEALSRFSKFLSQLPKRVRERTSHLICDLTETDFRVDYVPHLRANDRNAVLERKLNQTFRATPFRHAMLLGRQSDGRRDDQVLLSAITNPELVDAWVDVLIRNDVPIAGIYNAALLMRPFLNADSGANSNQQLLVTECVGVDRDHSESGAHTFRQTYFGASQLCFSRTIKLLNDDTQPIAERMLAEVRRTIQYLESMRLASDHFPVNVQIRLQDTPDKRRTMENLTALSTAELPIQVVGLAQSTGLNKEALRADEWLHSLLVAQKTTNHFATPFHTLRARVSSAKQKIIFASLAIALVGFVWGAVTLNDVNNERTAIELANTQAQQLRDEIANARLSSTTDSSASTLREVFLLANKVFTPAHQFDQLLVPLSHILNQPPYRAFTLEQVVWEPATAANIEPQWVPTKLTPGIAVTSQRDSGANADLPTSAAQAQADAAAERVLQHKPFQVALVELSAVIPAPQYRDLVVLGKAAAFDLAKATGWDVSVAQTPFSLSPNAKLIGSLNDTGTTERGRIVLRVVKSITPMTANKQQTAGL
jgi:hypothetical protein